MKLFISSLVLAFVFSVNVQAKSVAPPNAAFSMRILAEVLNTKTPQGKLVAEIFNKAKDRTISAVQYRGSETKEHENKTSTRRDTYLIVGTKSAVKFVRVVELSKPELPWFQSRTTKVTYEITPIQPGETQRVDPKEND